MNKLLTCRYNMDTNRVEARFEDGTTLAIDCIAVEDEYGNTPVIPTVIQRQSVRLPLQHFLTRQVLKRLVITCMQQL